MNSIKVQRILDRVGGNVLCNILSLFKLNKKIKSFEEVKNSAKILVINLWGMGDAVLTLPLIDEIKNRFPKAQLDVLATKRVEKIYSSQKNINTVLLLEDKKNLLKWNYYDLVFDTEHYLNTSALAAFYLGKTVIGYSHGQRAKLYSYTVNYNDKQHIVHTYLDLLRLLVPEIKNPTELVKLSYSKEDKEEVIKLLTRKFKNKFSVVNKGVNTLFTRINGIKENEFIIGFCVSSAESAHSRKWAKEKFAELADILIEKYGARIILVSGPGDFDANESVLSLIKNKDKALNAAKAMNVKKTIAVIDQCSLFISNDTGPMHVAAAQGVPTIGLFCPNTPVRYAPYGSKNISIYKPVLPEPCINVHKGVIPDCSSHNHMSKIEVEDVLRAVERVMDYEV